MNRIVKRVVKRACSRLGYSVRDVGTRVGGVDLMHDARVIIGDHKGPVLFDVGANIGQTAREMLDAFVSPRIYSFEPSPATFLELTSRFGRIPEVKCESFALGDAIGQSSFHVTADHSVNDSLMKPTWNAGGTTVEVRVDTLDNYCEREGIPSIDLLKIDTQGNDLKVLHGARRMLGEHLVKLYCCEVNFLHLYEKQPTLVDVLNFSNTVQYRIIGFYDQSYIKDRLSYLNVLFGSERHL